MTAAAIILAAGTSSRTAPFHKLLAQDREGCPMLLRTVREVMKSQAGQIIVILGPENTPETSELKALLLPFRNHRFSIVHAPHEQRSLSASLRLGVFHATPLPVSCLLVVLADMPLVTAEIMNQMIEQHALEHADSVTPFCNGQKGNPVLWDRTLFPALMALNGDKGARDLLKRHDLQHRQIDAGPEVLTDFDTPDRLELFRTL
ncbi:MAG: nucleotidyltransferase family protein [Acetobacter sp.]|jgi:molybdenum cofactor cytidylyltransferase